MNVPRRSAPIFLVVLLARAAITGYRLRDRLRDVPYVNWLIGGASTQTWPVPGSNRSGASPEPTTARGPVTIDPRRQQLIGVQTVAATRTTLTPTIRAIGAVRYDE